MNLTVEKKIQDFKERCLKRGYREPATKFKIDFMKYSGELSALSEHEKNELDRSPVKDENLFKISVTVNSVTKTRDSLRGFQIPEAVDDILFSIAEDNFPLKTISK